jgi:hypothetical protein
LPTTSVDAGVALVITIVVATGRADAGDVVSSETPATIRTEAAPIEITERSFL